MATIGVLPASGRASRIGGIPKFCLPISDDRSLLQWHVNQMLEVCDEVRISTRAEWVPIVQNMDLNAKIIVREPTTMSDAIAHMIGGYNDTVIVGMPDTYIINAKINIYKSLAQDGRDADLGLGLWECTENLRGRVGQIAIKNDRVVMSKDKDPECNFPYMWGTMIFNKNLIRYLDRDKNHPGEQIQEWIDSNLVVKPTFAGGEYMDIGTLKGLKELYRRMD